MKLPAIFTAALLASSSLLLAQSTAAKPKPLPSGDKAFAKKAADSLFLLSKMAEQVTSITRDGKTTLSPEVTALAKRLGNNGDVGKAWAEMAPVISAADATLLPSEVKGQEKTKLAALGKLKDTAPKYEKEFSEMTLKEAKELVRAFEGAKMLTTPELKAAAEKYLPTMKEIETDATKAKAAHK
jgi:hypothetical protein